MSGVESIGRAWSCWRHAARLGPGCAAERLGLVRSPLCRGLEARNSATRVSRAPLSCPFGQKPCCVTAFRNKRRKSRRRAGTCWDANPHYISTQASLHHFPPAFARIHCQGCSLFFRSLTSRAGKVSRLSHSFQAPFWWEAKR